MTFQSDKEFENEVIRIARLLWSQAEFGGPTVEDARERDGVFITDDFVYLIECTTSRTKRKAEHDITKLVNLARRKRLEHPTKAVKGWFITAEEPTPEQRAVANAVNRNGDTTNLVNISSFRQLKAKIINADAYLDSRKNYPFGSMRDPASLSMDVGNVQYIQPGIISSEGANWSIEQIIEGLQRGQRFVMTGDYGSGKSSTLREIFLRLLRSFQMDRSKRFPIMLNLRDHSGQDDTAEMLYRHARRVGFREHEDLVRAWRAGDAILLLDGFDELVMPAPLKRLREVRYESMAVLRRFIRESPLESGVISSGRSNYFDNIEELRQALGVSLQFTLLNLSEFTGDQVQEYVNKIGWKSPIPKWLPSRPLLLGHLISRGLLGNALDVEAIENPIIGWHDLLEMISKREAEMEPGFAAPEVRRLIESLATIARRTNRGRGPLSEQDIIQAFSDLRGYAPDARGQQLLLRLPGLGATDQGDGSREFIDEDFVTAAAAGDLVRYIKDPYTYEISSAVEWQSVLDPLGHGVSAHRCRLDHIDARRLSDAAYWSSKSDGKSTLCADLVEILKELPGNYSSAPIRIQDAVFDGMTIGQAEMDHSRISYDDCYFRAIGIESGVTLSAMPRFRSCYIRVIEGRASSDDLPPGVFDATCVIERYGNSSETGAAILALDLPLGVRVTLAILEKLYLQPGSGRKDSALRRGLDQRSRMLVSDVLQLLQQEQLILRSSSSAEPVWLPVRSEGARIRKIVSAPSAPNPLLDKAAAIQ